MVCFNRDKEGRCLAYNEADCSESCPARIETIEQKIELLICLLNKAQSKKDRRELGMELAEAGEYKLAQMRGKYDDWMSCYLDDKHRGTGGGASESDSNKKAGMKQLMKDNRDIETKPSRDQQAEYKEELKKWEEENGKLEKLGRTSLSSSKIDSYLGVPICFSDHGLGHCNGQRSLKGTLARDCRECFYLVEGEGTQK